MKLNWFSPLPPAKSEIAHYTARLLPVLAAHAEITLWSDRTEFDTELKKYAEVRCYRPEHIPWVDLNRSDMCVYHMGNSAHFHSSIWQVSRRHPGVVILHDTSLHHLFVEFYWDQLEDPHQYLAQMEYYYGEAGRRDASEFYMGTAHDIYYMAKQYPLTLLAVGNALGVLVHTQGAFEIIKHAGCQPVAYAPLPFAGEPRPPRHQSLKSLSESNVALCRLIVFGFIGDNRRLDTLLDALAGLPARNRFHLNVYGQISNEDSLRAKIYALGLDELVTLHGFVTEAELDAALATAHLAINLRYPSMGEASASQLRIWSYALPSLVTQVDWYATLPDDAVAFVRVEHEVEDIQAHLNAFLNEPARFDAMGKRGRQLLEEHHAPETYVQSLMNVVAAAQDYRPHAAFFKLAQKTGQDMSEWMTPAAFDRAREKVAGEIAAL